MAATEPNSKGNDTTLALEMVEDVPAQEQSVNMEKSVTAYQGESDYRPKSKEEKRLVRKLDMVIPPIAGLIYFVAYLDRNSIGNARLMGLEKDLNLTHEQFYNALTMFFVGYIICMLPGNICLRYVYPPILLGGCVFVFGAFCASLGGSKNYATLLALRVLVGSSQAFIQGLGLYSSFWYRRNELATRSACLYSFATLAGAFSGLIAYGVQTDLTKSSTGLEPWRWLFIIEGSMAMFVGILAFLCLPRFADQMTDRKSWLLTPSEIQLALDRAKGYNTLGAKVDLWKILTTLKDPKSWLFALVNAGVALGIASVGNFLPSIVRSFGYSPERAQLFTVIPYACAAVVMLTICFLSDRYNMKGPFLIFALSMSCVGYIIILSVNSIPAKVFATCLITSGLYPCVILLVTWLGINTAGFTKRGTTWAMAEIFGQCFSIMGSHVFTDPPRYIKGNSIVLGFLVMGIASSVVLIVYMNYLNKKKEAEMQEYLSRGETHPHTGRSLEEESDYHVAFRYIL